MKFLIIDDHPIVRFSVRLLLQTTWPEATIAEAESLENALQKLAEDKPDLITLDLSLPDTNGTEGVPRIMGLAQGVPILILSMNPEDAYAARLLKMGAAGYLPKNMAREELITAVKCILSGKRYATPAMADKLLTLLDENGAPRTVHELLSEQEYRIMLLMASGKSTNDIAEMMQLSAKTTSACMARILQKTGWKNRVELIRYCTMNLLIEKQ